MIKQATSLGSSGFKKFFLIITGVFTIIIVLHAMIQANREKSIRPIILEVGQRTLGADSYLYDKVKSLEQTPQKIYYQAKLEEIQKQFGSDPNRYQLEMIKVQTNWEKFKFQLSRVWIWTDILLTLFFLFTVFFLLYKGVDFIGNFSAMGNIGIALIVFILLQTSFTTMTYDSKLNDNKSFLELPIKNQITLLSPLKGIWSLGTHFTYIVGWSYQHFVVPITNAQESDNQIVSTVAKTFA